MDASDPFVSMFPPRKMTTGEVIRALRIDIAAEFDAVNVYMAHYEATDDERVKAVLLHIANEEKEHAAEFLQLLAELDPEQRDFLGEDHLAEILAEAEPGARAASQAAEGGPAGSAAGGTAPAGAEGPRGFTVGRMFGEPQSGLEPRR